MSTYDMRLNVLLRSKIQFEKEIFVLLRQLGDRFDVEVIDEKEVALQNFIFIF